MNLNHLAVFRAVAEHGSFTAAARALAADKAHVSRVMKALEDTLGVVLVSRTTRRVSLTPAGDGLLALVRGPLDLLERAGAAIADRANAPTGVVTLGTTPDLARVLSLRVLSRAPWTVVASSGGLPSVPAAMRALRRAVAALCARAFGAW